MSKKGLFALAVGYLAGVTAATFYGKNKKQLKKDLSEAKDNGEKAKIFFGAFVETHKNLVESVKKDLLTEENKQKFAEYKDEVLKIFDSYVEKWKELTLELKEKWVPYAENISKRLEELYNSKSEEIGNLKSLWKETIESLKEKLEKIFKTTKEEINEEVKKIENSEK